MGSLILEGQTWKFQLPPSAHKTPTKGLLCIPCRLQLQAPRALRRSFHRTHADSTASFSLPLGSVEKQEPHRPVLTPICKNPQFHSLNLENSHIRQLLLSQPLQLYFHFSCLNDGYYSLFSLSPSVFPLPRRAPLACLKITRALCWSSNLSHQANRPEPRNPENQPCFPRAQEP